MLTSLSTFVGRSEELRTLSLALSALESGEAALILLEGEPGIGKTRLADELCARARARGAKVARGAALAEAGAPALGPFRALARSIDPSLRTLLEAEVSDSSNVEDARWRRFEAFGEALVAKAREAPLVLMLDDLHDMDEGSLTLLSFLARHMRDGRFLIVGTMRDPATRASAANDALLARLSREAHVIRLAPLAVDEVRLLTAQKASDAEQIHALSGGNPLFVGEIMSVLRAGGSVSDVRVPSSIAAALRAKLERLTSAGLAAVRAAAMLGSAPSLPALAGVLDESLDSVLGRVSEPIRAGVFSDDGSLSVRFSHPLLREIALEDLPRGERAELHLACARALEALLDRGSDVPIAEIAHHRAAGLPAGDAGVALDWLARAADEAERKLSVEEAAALRTRAVEIADLVALSAGERCDLELSLARALSRAGARTRAREAATRAAALARTAGDAERQALSALARGADFLLGVVDHGLAEELSAAQSALGESSPKLLARIEARLAAALQPAMDPSVPLALARSAITRARGTDDDGVLLDTLVSAGSALADYAPVHERIAVSKELVALAVRLGQKPVALRGHLRLVLDQLEAADVHAADASIVHYTRIAESLKPPQYHWTTPLLRALRASMQGRFAEAEQASEQGRALATRCEDPNARICIALQSLARKRDQGTGEGSEELEQALEPLTRMNEGMRFWMSVTKASGLLRAGETARAFAEFASVPRNHPLFRSEPIVAALGAELLCEQAEPDLELLAALEQVMAPRRELCLSWGVMVLAWDAPFAYYLGLIARAQGQVARAIELFEQAYDLCTRISALPALLRASSELARTLQLRNVGADRTRAQALLRDAAQRARELGMLVLAQRCEQALSLAPPAHVPAAAAPAQALTLRSEGETWIVALGNRSVRLRESRGLSMLARLVNEEGRDIHVLELSAATEPGAGGDAGEVLDAEAIAAYRRRAAELREQLQEAEDMNESARAERARAELDALGEELSRGVGLGGRARRASSNAERARVNVQRRLKDVIERIRGQDETIATHLERALRTGAFCCYQR